MNVQMFQAELRSFSPFCDRFFAVSVIAVGSHIDLSPWNRRAFNLIHSLSDSLSQEHAACADADQDAVLNPFILFQNFMGNSR